MKTFDPLYLLAIFPFLFSIFPLLVALLIISGLEKFTFDEIRPSRDYKCKSWYLISLAALLLWLLFLFLPDTEFGHRLFHVSNGEDVSGWLFFVTLPLGMCLPAIGIWQPLWRAKGPIALRFIPAFLLVATALSPLCVWICVFMWPIGYFVIAPLTLIGFTYLIFSSVRSAVDERRLPQDTSRGNHFQ